MIKIPEGVSLEVSGSKFVARGPKGTIEKSFDSGVAVVEIANGEVAVKALPGLKERRSVSASVNSVAAHIKNALHGVSHGFEKKLTVIYAHFPITIEAKGSEVLVKNFLGEKSPRRASVVPGVQVKVEKQEITVSGVDREAVGQTAANIIQSARITRRDRRVFQDGIYLS